jgi:hypothetical protein
LGGTLLQPSAATLTAGAGQLILLSDLGAHTSLVVQALTQFSGVQHLATLDVGPTAQARRTPGTWALTVDHLAIAAGGVLDLADGNLVVTATLATRAAVLAELTGWVASGAAGLHWNGPGINSSAAATDPTDSTALGLMSNDNGRGGPFYPTFSGQTVDRNAILVKYTYYGDADLSGVVDGTDVALTDNGFNSVSSGWFNGDFNHDAVIDGTDYALLYNLYNQQGGPLAGAHPRAAAGGAGGGNFGAMGGGNFGAMGAGDFGAAGTGDAIGVSRDSAPSQPGATAWDLPALDDALVDLLAHDPFRKRRA